MFEIFLCAAMISLLCAEASWSSSEISSTVENLSISQAAEQQRNVTLLNFTDVNYAEELLTTDQQKDEILSPSMPPRSGDIILHTDEENLLKMMENSFATLEEDLLSGCLEESDVEKLIQTVKEEMNGKLLRFFFLVLILFFVSTAISIYAVVQSRRSVLGRNISRKAIFRYKKSFVNESETIQSEQCPDAENNSTFHFDETSLNSNSLRCRNNSSQYTVSV